MLETRRNPFLTAAGRRRRRAATALWLMVMVSAIFALFAIVQAIR